MQKIILPASYNYCSVFLTFRCALGCSYCINHQGEFKRRKELSGDDWIYGLSRIQTREDLPLTISGGEPTLHKDFYRIADALFREGKDLDLLTNGEFEVEGFMRRIGPEVFKRPARYASIRFSFHENTNGYRLFNKVFILQDRGYSVGIWGLKHPTMEERNKIMKLVCTGMGVDYREKDYLTAESGVYKYPDCLTGEVKQCWCKPSELLIAPDGHIYRCHRDLYAGRGAFAHILDREVKLVDGFRACIKPKCNFCDLKEKFDRFQQTGHCAVEIRGVKR